MDPGTVALTVAGLLATKALEAAGGRVGESAWAALGRIADAVRARFRADREVTESLNRLDAKPTSQARTAEVAEVLKPRLDADPDFTTELAQLVKQAKTDSQIGPIVTVIQGNAQVGKVTNIGSIIGDIQI